MSEGKAFQRIKIIKTLPRIVLAHLTAPNVNNVKLPASFSAPDTALVPASSRWPPPRVIMLQQNSPFCFVSLASTNATASLNMSHNHTTAPSGLCTICVCKCMWAGAHPTGGAHFHSSSTSIW